MTPAPSASKVRLVSLLPSATEMACAIGLAECVVGISHCCDYPAEIRDRPVLVHSRIPGDGQAGLAEIDAAASSTLRRGESLYEVDVELLARLAPTHIVTQDLCQVCAPSGNEVTRAMRALPTQPQVLWMSPHSLADIEENLRELGRCTGRVAEARRVIMAGRRRMQRATRAATTAGGTGRPPPRVFCAEWIDPLYCAGHWVPEMVEKAGGIDPLGRRWADSVRVSWEAVREAAPEVMILLPCGFDAASARRQAGRLVGLPGWEDLPAVRANRVFAVDGAYFNRPGPRVFAGVELLAHLLHPEEVAWTGPADAIVQITPTASPEV
ncbi:MAG TPA: cobalamin-binding protein [Verrucomicrobiales bacterium]|nr:cobalamin-binding protein [Verrucomicrobiales bacterium]